VTAIDAAGGGGTVQDLAYGYDDASNITSIPDGLNTNRNQTFAYDNLNRVTSATGLYGTNTYAYDSVGNRMQKTITVPFSSTDTYTTASTSNRLNSIAGGTTRSLTYEASGQALTDQRSPVDAWTYTTDKAGRMTEAKLNTVTQATFAYDADELRIRKTKTSTGAITHYIYDGDGQLIAEMDGATGDPIREYIWLGGLPIGYVDRLGTSGASRLFFIHADHLARPQKITDGSRAIVWDGVFAPFGEIHSITGSIVNVLMLPGQIYDPETGLSQNWHRDYDANIGRYLQSDPIGLEGGINTYAYVGGNPTTLVDPTGLSSGEASFAPPPRLRGDGTWKWNADGGNSRGGVWRNCFGDTASWDAKGNHWDVDERAPNGDVGRQRYSRWGIPLSKKQAHSYRGPRHFPLNPRGRAFRGGGRILGSAGYLGGFLDYMEQLTAPSTKDFQSEGWSCMCGTPDAPPGYCACKPPEAGPAMY
jgi:RHS repeat-associated protein